MKSTNLVVLCLIVTFASAPLCFGEPVKKPTGAEASVAAEKWIEDLGEKGLVLTQKADPGELSAAYAPSGIGRITKFGYMQDGWWISLAFKGEIKADTPIETVRKQLWHVVLDRVPTPGLELPGWDVRPRTPRSSFSEGVEILDYGQGKIKVRVRTNFFALYGRDPSVLVPADAPSPPGSYFMIRKAFPLDLTFEGTFTLE